MKIVAIFVVCFLVPCLSQADETQCTDIPSDKLKYDYDSYDDGGTLSITIPAEVEGGTFVHLRADYGTENEVSFWLETAKEDGELSALVGVPPAHEILQVTATYTYRVCYALLSAKFVDGKRVE